MPGEALRNQNIKEVIRLKVPFLQDSLQSLLHAGELCNSKLFFVTHDFSAIREAVFATKAAGLVGIHSDGESANCELAGHIQRIKSLSCICHKISLSGRVTTYVIRTAARGNNCSKILFPSGIMKERHFFVHEHQGLFEGLRSESASDVFFLADRIITAEVQKLIHNEKRPLG